MAGNPLLRYEGAVIAGVASALPEPEIVVAGASGKGWAAAGRSGCLRRRNLTNI
jgi:hypothetical protein